MSKTKRNWKPATALVHGGTMRSSFGETSEAIYLTQGFVYPTAESAEARFKGEEPGFIYSRYANPTVDMFERRMCELEGAEDARAMSSGMAAVAAALLCSVKAGDHVVAAKALFGSCRYIIDTLMPKYGIQSTLIDGADIKAWQDAVKPNTKLFFLESPTNPTLEVVDIRAVADIANAIGAKLVVDNVFATPCSRSRWNSARMSSSIRRPSTLTARAAASAASCCRQEVDRRNLHDYFRHTGPSLSPFNAWTLLKGLETLPLRVRQQTEAAGLIADHLANHPKIERVIYPGRKDHPQRT
jgi:O-succinylhomoserine sulfhydrylase